MQHIVICKMLPGECMYYWALLLLLFPIAINSMESEKSLQRVEKVFVLNQTTDKIAVHYKLRNANRSYTRILTPDQSLKLDNPDNLEILNITTYGKFKKWFSLHTLSYGYWGLRNLADDIQERIKKGPHKRFAILRVQGWSYVGPFLPYSFDIELSDKEPVHMSILEIWDAFPRAKEAKESNRKIEPRYILGLPEASRENITHAYERLKAEWQPKVQSKSEFREAFFAQDALNLIEAAYKSLMGGRVEKAQFDLEIAQELDAQTMYSSK